MFKKPLSLWRIVKVQECLLTVINHIFTAWIFEEWHITRFKLWRQHPWNSASGAFSLICACTPEVEELIEAVVSYACPRQFLISISCFCRTSKIPSAMFSQLSSEENESQVKLHASLALYEILHDQFPRTLNKQTKSLYHEMYNFISNQWIMWTFL